MQVTSPRVRDERVDADADRCRFTSETLPPYMRRSPKVAQEPVEKFVKQYDDKYPNAPQGYTALHGTTPHYTAADLPLANFWLGLWQTFLRQWVTVELGRIFVGDHPNFVVGERPQNVFHDVLGVWPGAISVGIV